MIVRNQLARESQLDWLNCGQTSVRKGRVGIGADMLQQRSRPSACTCARSSLHDTVPSNFTSWSYVRSALFVLVSRCPLGVFVLRKLATWTNSSAALHQAAASSPRHRNRRTTQPHGPETGDNDDTIHTHGQTNGERGDDGRAQWGGGREWREVHRSDDCVTSARRIDQPRVDDDAAASGSIVFVHRPRPALTSVDDVTRVGRDGDGHCGPVEGRHGVATRMDGWMYARNHHHGVSCQW
jgi:hypothetical protein